MVTETIPLTYKVRSDALPENTTFLDDGCDVHPHCLSCPLFECRYVFPGGIRGMRNLLRDKQIRAMKDSGIPRAEIAFVLGISQRTVDRATNPH